MARYLHIRWNTSIMKLNECIFDRDCRIPCHLETLPLKIWLHSYVDTLLEWEKPIAVAFAYTAMCSYAATWNALLEQEKQSSWAVWTFWLGGYVARRLCGYGAMGLYLSRCIKPLYQEVFWGGRVFCSYAFDRKVLSELWWMFNLIRLFHLPLYNYFLSKISRYDS